MLTEIIKWKLWVRLKYKLIQNNSPLANYFSGEITKTDIYPTESPIAITSLPITANLVRQGLLDLEADLLPFMERKSDKMK